MGRPSASGYWRGEAAADVSYARRDASVDKAGLFDAPIALVVEHPPQHSVPVSPVRRSGGREGLDGPCELSLVCPEERRVEEDLSPTADGGSTIVTTTMSRTTSWPTTTPNSSTQWSADKASCDSCLPSARRSGSLHSTGRGPCGRGVSSGTAPRSARGGCGVTARDGLGPAQPSR